MRRQKSVVLSQSIVVALSSNFRAINRLSDFLKRELKLNHLKGEFTELKMDKSETVKHNCEILQERTEKLHKIVCQLDKVFQERLETHLYMSLGVLHADFSTTIAVAGRAMEMLSDLLNSHEGVVLVATVSHRKLLRKILSSLKAMGSTVMAETVLSALMELLKT